MTTAWARNSKLPTAVRFEGAARRAVSGSSTVPCTSLTWSPSKIRPSTWCRKAKRTRPDSVAARAFLTNGSEMPVPVPQGMWNLGTELPWLRTRRMRVPTAGPIRPRGVRPPGDPRLPSPASPARRGRRSRERRAGAAWGSRPGTGPRTTSAPGRRGWPRSPARRQAADGAARRSRCRWGWVRRSIGSHTPWGYSHV